MVLQYSCMQRDCPVIASTSKNQKCVSVKHDKNFGSHFYLDKFLNRYYSVPCIVPPKSEVVQKEIPKFWQCRSTNRKSEHLKPVSTPNYWLLVLCERDCSVHIWRFSQPNWTQPVIICLSGLYMNKKTLEHMIQP